MPKKARTDFLPALPPSPEPPVAMTVEPVDEAAVFDKKEPVAAAAEPVQTDAATDKKAKLREHLAKCREKSIAVRKEKAAVKKANKRPVGRPRKHPIKEAAPAPDPEPEPAPEIPEPSVQPAVPRVAVPPPQPEMMDYDRLAGLVAARMRPAAVATVPAAVATVPAAAPQNANDMTAFLNAFGNTVRENERAKVKAEREAKQKAQLDLSTKKYFSRLPKNTGGDPWDALFNPR